MKNLIFCIAITTSVFSQSSNLIIHFRNGVRQPINIVTQKAIMDLPMFVKTLSFSSSIPLQNYNIISRYSNNILTLNDYRFDNNQKSFSPMNKRKMLEKGLAGSMIVGLFGLAVGGFSGNERVGITVGSTIGSTLGFLDYKKSNNPNISFPKILIGSFLGGTTAYFLLTSSKNTGVAVFKVFGAFVLPPLGAYISVNL